MEKCKMADRCGGCTLQGIDYPAQLHIKQVQCKKLLGRFGKVQPITGMEVPTCYRAKVHHAFGLDRAGRIISGSYEESTHRIVPGDGCMLEDEICRRIIRTIREMLKSFHIPVYNEKNSTGIFRHVLLRRGFGTGEVMAVLVTASPVFPSKHQFIKALLEKHPEITTVVQSVNDRFGSMVLGKRMITLHGKGFINETLCGLTFRISPSAFFQVNPVMAEKLYNKAIELAALTGTEKVIDAYCGTGTIGLCAARSAGSVLGIELNPDAVRDAVTNARVNGIRNARFIAGDATELLESQAQMGEIADVILMDPPRAGSTARFLSAAAGMKPRSIVYVSCNPETLARDVGILKGLGYEPRSMWPYDMFPFTAHVETVVALSQRKPDDIIHVGIDLKPEDVTAAESKATYADLQAYIEEKYGFKVSNLYIAQAKAALGIKERENYNKPKTPENRVPACPPEKMKSIQEALRHFQMI